jgi:hypothetical protein
MVTIEVANWVESAALLAVIMTVGDDDGTDVGAV